jgi:hypothetical protein
MRRAACLFVAAAILAASPTPALPALGAKPQFEAAPVELARHKRHHKARRDAAAKSGAAVVDNLFWPLEIATPDGDDPACAFVGCAPGWTLGPLAWGLYGVGFADPLGLSR